MIMEKEAIKELLQAFDESGLGSPSRGIGIPPTQPFTIVQHIFVPGKKRTTTPKRMLSDLHHRRFPDGIRRSGRLVIHGSPDF